MKDATSTEKATLAVGVANILITLGLLLTAYWGLNTTAKQIESTADQIEGATLYQVARDGRELMKGARSGETMPEDVLSYFHSTFLLHERGVIDDDGWQPIQRAYCDFILVSEPARAYLQDNVRKYDAEFVSFSNAYERAGQCD